MAAFMSKQGLDPLNFIAEYFVVLLFFAPLEKRGGKHGWLGYVCLLIIAPLYFYSSGSPASASPLTLINPFIRWGVYFAAVAGYLHFQKAVSLPQALYFSAFYANFYNAARTLVALTNYIPFSASSAAAQSAISLVLSVAVLALEFVVAKEIHRVIDFSQIKEIGHTRVWVVALTNFLLIYFKTSSLLNPTKSFAGTFVDQFLYPVCAILAILALLVLLESYQASQNRRRELEVDQVTRRFEQHSAEHTIEANNNLRRVYHDMKNHLLAIRALDADKNAVSDYVDSLLSDISDYDSLVATGLPVMDAFLSEKLRAAQSLGVRCNICADLSPLSFMSGTDLIAIFGNAMDNAVEAAAKLPDADARLVFLKSSCYANTILLRFTNSYSGELRQRDGKLLTTKDSEEYHGIGLRSIEKAAQRCGGGTDIEIDEEQKLFNLTVMLPLREAAEV